MINRQLRAILGSSAITFLVACGADSTVTPDGSASAALAARASAERALAVELTTAASGDAGIIFSIEGPNIVGIATASGFELVARHDDANGRSTIDVLLAGPLRSGVIAWLTVKGVNSGSPFNTRVSQVAAGAAGGFAQRTDLGAYQLNVRR